jgi:hypothetical protein
LISKKAQKLIRFIRGAPLNGFQQAQVKSDNPLQPQSQNLIMYRVGLRPQSSHTNAAAFIGQRIEPVAGTLKHFYSPVARSPSEDFAA